MSEIESKDYQEKLPAAVMQKLLGREDLVFLGSVTFLVRLEIALRDKANRESITDILIQYEWHPTAEPTAPALLVASIFQDSRILGVEIGRAHV